MAILELKDVNKIFTSEKGKEVPAVQNVSLKVEAGASVGIVGESGCGKSTIARLITRLINVSSGKIYLDGEEISSLSSGNLKKIYRQVQMVFQDPYGVFSPRMTIGTFLQEGLVSFGIMNKNDAKKEAVKLLEMVELSADYMDRLPHQLSGGQLQRIVIARAISIHPKLIILDEATSALDVSVQKQVLKLLVKLQKQFNLTYLFIGHDLAVVRSITDSIAVMYAGTIVEKLPSKNLEEAKHPYTKKLLESVFSVHDREEKQIKLETLSMEDAGYMKQGCVYQLRCPYCDETCRNIIPDLRNIDTNHIVSCHKV